MQTQGRNSQETVVQTWGRVLKGYTQQCLEAFDENKTQQMNSSHHAREHHMRLG